TAEHDAPVGFRRMQDHVDVRTAMQPHAVDHDRPRQRHLRKGNCPHATVAPDIFQHDCFKLGLRHSEHLCYPQSKPRPLWFAKGGSSSGPNLPQITDFYRMLPLTTLLIN